MKNPEKFIPSITDEENEKLKKQEIVVLLHEMEALQNEISGSIDLIKGKLEEKEGWNRTTIFIERGQERAVNKKISEIDKEIEYIRNRIPNLHKMLNNIENRVEGMFRGDIKEYEE